MGEAAPIDVEVGSRSWCPAQSLTPEVPPQQDGAPGWQFSVNSVSSRLQVSSYFCEGFGEELQK